MRAYRFMLMAAILATCAGCGTRYVDSKQPGAAIVKFQNQTSGYFIVHRYAGDERCTEQEGIGMLEPGAEKAIKFEPRRIATFAFGYLDGGSTCSFAGSFMPKENQSYVVLIAVDTGHCYLAVRHGADAASGIREPSFVLREYKQPFVASQGFCSVLDAGAKKALESAAASP